MVDPDEKCSISTGSVLFAMINTLLVTTDDENKIIYDTVCIHDYLVNPQRLLIPSQPLPKLDLERLTLVFQ